MNKNDTITKEIPDRYYRIGGVQGITYFYLLSECCLPSEDDMSLDRVIKYTDMVEVPGYISELTELVSDALNMEKDPSDTEKRSVGLREKIKETATDVYAYRDIIGLWEYVLKRTKPVDAQSTQSMNDEACARDILSAIFKTQSNASINENICVAVSKLPLRMTKSRFKDIMFNELKIYADGPKSAFDRNMFILGMCAGISDRPVSCIPQAEKLIEELNNTDFKNMDSKKKEELDQKINKCIELLDDYRDVLELTVQTLDNMLVCVKNRNDADEALGFIDGLRDIADEAAANFKNGKRSNMSERSGSLFNMTEGVADTEFEKIASLLGRYINDSAAENSIYLEHFRRFSICDKLLSQSYYADLEDDIGTDEEAMGKEAVDKELEVFFDKFDKVTANDPKQMQRARMASVFMNIPVFFSSRTEVMNYVLESLSGCRDQYEKEVCVNEVLEILKK